MNRTAVSLALLSLSLLPGLAQAQSLPTSYNPVSVPTLGGRESYAYKINNKGEVSGAALTTAGLASAIYWNPTAGVKSLGTLQNTGNSYGYSINDGSRIAGYSSTTTGNRGVARTAGATLSVWTNVGVVPGGTSSVAWGINNLGNIVGQSLTPTGNRAFLWSNGVIKDLGTLGGKVAYAIDVNDTNQVTGYASNASNLFRAFLYTNGAMKDLGTLGGNSFGYAVNSLGDVAGSSITTGGTRHAFLYTNGAMKDLGTLGGTISNAYAVNDSGIVVGDSTDINGMTWAMVYAGGKMVKLNAMLPANSGWILTSARSINANGQIAGIGYLKGQLRGFVLNPIP